MARLWMVVAVFAFCSVVTQAGRLYGGPETIGSDSPGVQDALKFALYEYNRGSNDLYAARSVTVRKVQRQLVAGTKYLLDVDIGRTQCRKPTADVDSCDLHTDPELSKIFVCHFVVLTIPWKEITQMLKFNCD